MLLSDVYSRLALGELQSTNAIDPVDATLLTAAAKIKVVNYLNEAVTNLFTRFVLLEKEILINREDTITFYYLRPEFAVSNAAVVPVKYLDDSGIEDFTGNVIKVLKVYDVDGLELPINDNLYINSVHTPQYDCLQIMASQEGDLFSVIYQARHADILIGDESQEIEIPLFLEKPLLSYVASKHFSHMNGKEHIARGQTYMALYEKACNDIVMRDSANTSLSSESYKFDGRGFV